MKSLVKYHIALVAFVFLSLQAFTQQYPVQANLSVSPPYPNKVSSFFPLSGSKLQLSVLLTDVSQPEVQVRVRVKIEGAGLTIQSKNNPAMPIFIIQGGVPKVFSQELEPYFRIENLMASGNGAGQFMQNGILPEGFFTISITIIEHWRNVQISSMANAYAWIMVNDPPQLITPSNNQTVEPGGMQNIFMSWIPRHVAVPTSGGQISYNLSVWEVPQGFNPQMVVNSLQPIETVNILSTSFVWGPANTPLTPGKLYVVQVKAIDSSNEVVFRNNGLSVPHSFVYGQPCLTPINLNHSNVFIETADVQWFPLGTAQNFRVELKTSAEGNDAWRAIDVAKSSTTLTNLMANATYNYRVSAVCGSFTSIPSPEKSFKTQSVPELNNECSSSVGSFSSDGTPLLSDLQSGMIFFASGFPVEINTFSSVGANTFNGDGMIFLPLFNFGLKAKLNRIKINLSLQLVDGTVEAIVSDDLTIVGGGASGSSGPGAVDFSNPNDTVHINSPIDTLYINADSTWTVVTDDGGVIIITPNEGGTLVVDADGNGVVIIDGQVYPVSDALDPITDGDDDGGGAGGGSGTAITPTSICNQTITFSPGGSLHKYGFDPYREFMPPGTYKTITADGQTLHLPWKSVASSGSDRLYANPATDSLLTFAYESGMQVQANAANEGYNVWTTSPPGGEDNLLALCSTDTIGNASVAGGVRVKSYDLVRHRVTIVPVGDSQPSFTRQQLQDALNDIYGPAVVEWEVTFQDPIDGSTVPNLESGLEVNNTDYSEAMRSVWRAYVMQRSSIPGTTYLFIIPSFTDNPGMAGYMPLKSSYGFLTPQATTRDAAHELGHGKFNLRHTFSEHNVVYLPEGSTQNLMDYSIGTELFKYQWDFIHNPEGGWFVFEDSEEGAMYNNQWDQKVKEVIEKIKNNNLNGAGNDFYLTFSNEEEDIIYFGRDIVLGDKIFNYIRIDGPITPYDDNYRKTIVSNMYTKDTVRTEKIPHSSSKVEVIPFNFLKFNNTYQQFEPAFFEVFVLKEDAEDFEEYISSVTGLKLDTEEMMNMAISVAASIPGVSAECSNGLRHYVLELVGDSILFSINLGGKIPNEGQANDMYNFFEDNNKGLAGKKKFHEVSFQEAVSLCQSGYLIITAYYNPNGSGHVNALLPEMIYINYGWSWFINGKDKDPLIPKPSELPVVFDTGDNKRYPNPDTNYSNQKLTNAYGSDKHKYVKFYMYLDN